MNIFQHIDKKTVIGFGVIIVILLATFFYYLPGNGTDNVSTTLTTSSQNTALGQDLLQALAKLKSTKLDTDVWGDPLFISLKDFGIEIASQPVGRRNPFAVFDGVAKPGDTSVKVPSLPKGKTVSPTTPANAGQTGKPVVTPLKKPTTGGGFDVE